MKTILVFGDSITWGFDPDRWVRYDYEKTWPGVMQSSLGNEYRVVTDALSGRTTCWDRPFVPDKNGKIFFPSSLEAQSPLDAVIIMLGTNDMIKSLNKTAEEAAWGIFSLMVIVQKSMSGREGKIPHCLIISPPHLGPLSPFMSLSYEGRQEESKKLAGFYKIIADQTHSSFLNAASIIKASDTDGVHPKDDQLKILGEAAAQKIREMNL